MKNRMVTKCMRACLSLVVVGSVGSAFAGGWTGKGGDLDIANPLNWNITTGTMSGNDMEWNTGVKVDSPTILTCSKDFDFNRLCMRRSEPLIYAMEGHTIEATGIPAIRFEGSGCSLTIRNGSYISSSDSTQDTNGLRLYYTDNEMVFEGNMATGSFRAVHIGVPLPNGTGVGQRNRLIVRDGAVVKVNGGDTKVGANGDGNCLIIDGGTFTTSGILYMGTSADSRTNELQVLNGGLLEVNRFPNGAGAAVSNRIVLVDSKFQLHGYCRISGSRDGSFGTQIEMKGASQVINDGDDMTFIYDTDIYFTFPEPEKCTDYAAFVCGSTSGNNAYMQINDVVNLHFDTASMKKISSAGGGQLVLFRAAKDLRLANKTSSLARWTAAANEAYEGATVTVAGSNTIAINIPKAKSGLCLIIR